MCDIPHPPNVTPVEVKSALRSLVTVASESDAERGYHRLLSSLGNDHAGTYFPVAVCVVPFIGELLRYHNPMTRKAALNALADLTTSFEPEPGFETFTFHGTNESVADALRDAVNAIRGSIESIVESGVSAEEQTIARQLLEQQSR